SLSLASYPLVVGEVHGRRGFTSQTVVLCVLDYSHDFVLSPLFRSPTEMLTHWVLVIETLAHHRFVNHNDLGRAFAILLAKLPTQQQRNSHGFKKSRSYVVHINGHLLVGFWFSPFHRQDATCLRVTAANQATVGKACRINARNRFDTLQNLSGQSRHLVL